jgi:Polysaccharide lyase
VTGRIPVVPRLLRLAVAILLVLGLVGCPRPSVPAGDEWKVIWSAPGQDISEWHTIQLRKNATDRIQSLAAPSGGTDRAFKFAVWNNDVAVNNSCVDIESGWRAEGRGPTEQVSNRTIRYEWNTWFEQSFPGNPVASGQPIWVVFTQWHQKDPSTEKSPPIEFIVEDGWLRLGLHRVDPAKPTNRFRSATTTWSPSKPMSGIAGARRLYGRSRTARSRYGTTAMSCKIFRTSRLSFRSRPHSWISLVTRISKWVCTENQ